jgi:hypothetical protein
MSFAYKTLKGSDISISPYVANKQYTYPSSELTSSGITVYTGEYIPQYMISGTVYNAFDPINDIKNNGYYRRLIFDSILKLYYQNWVSGSQSGVFFGSSSYDNYDQTTIASGTLEGDPVTKFLSLETGSGGVYGTSFYDSASFAVLENTKIRVISIPQDIYGNGIEPGTFVISSSTYYIKDDGQGNLWDYTTSGSLYNKDPYNGAYYAGGDTTRIYVGNIVYSPGFAIITNPEYLCFYPSEPVAVNDNYTILNVSSSKVLPILDNDFDDCNLLDDSTVTVYPLSGYTFPSFSIIGGEIHITDCGANNLQVTPGDYKILYSVNSTAGVTSNLATCSLIISSGPLTSSLISYTSGCFGTVTNQSATFSVDLGIPPYSYSLDNINWVGLPSCDLYQPTFSVSIPTADSVDIYIKDSVGSSRYYNLDTKLPPISFAITSQSTCPATATGVINVTATGGTGALSASITPSPNVYFPIPHTFNNLAFGTYNVFITDGVGCTTQSVALITNPPPITISLVSTEADCPGSPSTPNGAIEVSVTGGSGTKDYRWWNGSSFVKFTEDPTELAAGTYQLFVSDSTGCNNATSSNIVVGSVVAVSLTGLNIVSSSCYGGGAGGSITASINSGVGSGSLYWAWSGPSSYTNAGTASQGSLPASISIGNLFTGSYSLTITDSATGCYYNFGPYQVNEPTEFKSSSFTIDRTIGNGPYRTRFAFQGGTLDTGGGYTASLFLSSSAGLSLQYVVSASTTSTQQLLLTQSCLTASTNWVLFAEDDNGCQMTNFSPSYYISLAPQVVQQTPVCYSASVSTDVCNCISGSPTIFYLSSSFANSVTASTTILNPSALFAVSGTQDGLIWADCAQTITASVGSYSDGLGNVVDIGLGTGVAGWVNNWDPCPIPLVRQLNVDIVNGFGGKVTSTTTIGRYFNSVLTSSNYSLPSFNDTTSSALPIPLNGFLEISGYADQALDPLGTVGALILINSGSSAYQTLYSGSLGTISGNYSLALFPLNSTLSYNLYITYDSQYSPGGSGITYCQDASFGGGCFAVAGCICPPGYTPDGCFQPTPC